MESKNQIDVRLEIENILIESGLEYLITYNPEENIYHFVLTNIDVKGGSNG